MIASAGGKNQPKSKETRYGSMPWIGNFIQVHSIFFPNQDLIRIFYWRLVDLDFWLLFRNPDWGGLVQTLSLAASGERSRESLFLSDGSFFRYLFALRHWYIRHRPSARTGKIADKAEIKMNQMLDVALAATPITTCNGVLMPSLAPKIPALKIFKRSVKFFIFHFLTPYLGMILKVL